MDQSECKNRCTHHVNLSASVCHTSFCGSILRSHGVRFLACLFSFLFFKLFLLFSWIHGVMDPEKGLCFSRGLMLGLSFCLSFCVPVLLEYTINCCKRLKLWVFPCWWFRVSMHLCAFACMHMHMHMHMYVCMCACAIGCAGHVPQWYGWTDSKDSMLYGCMSSTLCSHPHIHIGIRMIITMDVDASAKTWILQVQRYMVLQVQRHGFASAWAWICKCKDMALQVHEHGFASAWAWM
jgi:hypothetical protein